jgi:hypothetical protein
VTRGGGFKFRPLDDSGRRRRHDAEGIASRISFKPHGHLVCHESEKLAVCVFRQRERLVWRPIRHPIQAIGFQKLRLVTQVSQMLHVAQMPNDRVDLDVVCMHFGASTTAHQFVLYCVLQLYVRRVRARGSYIIVKSWTTLVLQENSARLRKRLFKRRVLYSRMYQPTVQLYSCTRTGQRKLLDPVTAVTGFRSMHAQNCPQ